MPRSLSSQPARRQPSQAIVAAMSTLPLLGLGLGMGMELGLGAGRGLAQSNPPFAPKPSAAAPQPSAPKAKPAPNLKAATKPAPPAVAALLIDLSSQRLSAFDLEHRLLYRRPVSSGRAASPTPTGEFHVAGRFLSTPMRGRDYYMPAVPHALCLAGGGLAPNAICIHGAPWQEAAGEPFGVRRSHGCVRTGSATARWLFERTPLGTPVKIQP